MAQVVIIGPAHPLRGGGITTFNHRLAKEFIDQGHDCSIYSFSLQYPSFLFPGKSQFTDGPAPEGIHIKTVINSVNPLNWKKVGSELEKQRPDLVIVRFWLPFMGPALGTILRSIKKNRHTKIICIADNVIPHEKRTGDKPFTRYFLKACDGFITMSEKVMADLRTFEPVKPARLVPHPLYDNFGTAVPKTEARKKLNLPEQGKLLLFFGFIRKYKGLDLLFEAMSHPQVREMKITLLVAGEFYEDETRYRELVDRLGISEQLILRTGFIPDDEVKYFICAADAIVQPYRQATQSGVTPLAYHFEKPMIVTNVGGLPAFVEDGSTGIVTKPDALSIASGILQFYELGENHFIPHLHVEKQKYSWPVMLKTIFELASEINKS